MDPRQKFIKTQGEHFADMDIHELEENIPYIHSENEEKVEEGVDLIFKTIHYGIAKKCGCTREA